MERAQRSVSLFREKLPQVLASSANNFFRMNVSLSLGFATVVIAQLHGSDDPLSLDDTTASWLGSIAYICQPVGSVASGVIVELIGRKRFLVALNIPFLLGLILLCVAPSYPVLLLANVIIGITVGFTEAPNNSYNGEVCQPGLRGAMSASSGIFYQLGFFMQFLLGTLTHWRTAAAISTVIPISTFICVCLIPEVPIWLISRGRVKDAEKALQWLRGWVPASDVQRELAELVRYHEETKLRKKQCVETPPDIVICNNARESNVVSSDEPEITPVSKELTSTSINQSEDINKQISEPEAENNQDIAPSQYSNNNDPQKVGSFQMLGVLRELFRPPTLRPLLLVIPFFFFVHFAGLTSIRPFMVLVFREFQLPVGAEWFTVVSGGCGLLGSVLLMVFVRLLGKRLISLVGTALSALAVLLLGTYAYLRPADENGHLMYTWIPLVLIVTLSFCNSIVEQIPSILISEVYPFRTRGLSVGISVAFCYLFIFLASKTYLDIEHALELHGAFLLYGSISCVGYVFLHLLLLETEGKSLQDIEHHYTQGLSATSTTGRSKGSSKTN